MADGVDEAGFGAGGRLDDVDVRLRRGLVRCHQIDAQQSQQNLAASVDVAAVTELLLLKGVIRPEELEAMREQMRPTVVESRMNDYIGPTLYPVAPEDKARPDVLVDCRERYSACASACCTLYNVYLTADEVMSGLYRWDLGHPYRLERGPEGHCTYLDRATNRCGIWEQRPIVCRRYTCSSDRNVWVDFEGKIGTGAGRARRPEGPVTQVARSTEEPV